MPGRITARAHTLARRVPPSPALAYGPVRGKRARGNVQCARARGRGRATYTIRTSKSKYVFDPHTAPVRDWCNVNPAELVTGRAWVQRAAAKHVRPQGRGSCSAEGWGPRYEISAPGARRCPAFLCSQRREGVWEYLEQT